MSVEQNDVLRVTLKMTYGASGQDVQNVNHFISLDAAPLANATVFTELGPILETIYTAIQARLSDTLKYITYEVVNITQDQILGAAPFPTFTQGGTATAAVSAQVAALIYLPTITPRVQGRVYIGGCTEADVVNSFWETALLTALATSGALLLTPKSVTNGRLLYQVYNRILFTVANPVAAVVVGAARTQRRRTRGFGS